MSEKEMEIVLCIPGPWADRSELVQSIVKDSGGYIFSGMVLMNLETKQSYELDFCGVDERMLSAFEASGPHWKNTAEMELISSHKSVCYLIAKGGSIESAHSIMNAANALLDAGGYGVKVESSGLSHPPKDWKEQCKYNYLFKSHSSYVVYITSESTYSCGMHNFGLPDAIVNSSESENPSELLRVFTHYLLSESPVIKEGQTFSVDSDSPAYRIKAHPPIYYGESSLFNNPFGMWKLQAC
ncbi:DUF4261 domain-containing protein [Idiomarina sp.]|uniref:DUF4261 domain-containing protein n=1 Tax=Idiomarina sp. TaxID=1874361 RepID=UPI003A90037F